MQAPKPFERDRLAVLSVMGGNWEEYGQVVLQMAILDTLLSIEELLKGQNGTRSTCDGSKLPRWPARQTVSPTATVTAMMAVVSALVQA